MNDSILSRARFALAGCAAAALFASTSAFADPFYFLGNSDGTERWHRPEPALVMDNGGADVAFDVLHFQVKSDGVYDIRTMPKDVNGLHWDAVTFLYQDAFDPTAPLQHAMVGNDDYTDTSDSGFDKLSLTVGTDYYLVITGFGHDDFGEYHGYIQGTGLAFIPNNVPAPGTSALVVTGLIGIGAARRRKRARSAG